MRTHRGLLRSGLVALSTIAVSSIAIAAGGNKLHVRAPASVTSGHAFTVHVSGAARGQGYVQVYLDRRKCASTTDKERSQAGIYKSGKSYFVVVGEGTSKSTVAGLYVAPDSHNAQALRQFKESLKGHAGTKAGHEHVCAYLQDGYGKSLRAKTAYTVK